MVALKLQQPQYNLKKVFFFGAWYFLCLLGQVTPPIAGVGGTLLLPHTAPTILLRWCNVHHVSIMKQT